MKIDLVTTDALSGIQLIYAAKTADLAFDTTWVVGNRKEDCALLIDYAQRANFRLAFVPDHHAPELLDGIRQRQVDLVLQIGSVILRPPFLAAPKLGVLNLHAGLLPRYRGLDSALWAALEGGAHGVSAHFIAAGIDTGPIVLRKSVPLRPEESLGELLARTHNHHKWQTFVRAACGLRDGRLKAQEQAPDAGRQYFSMHPRLVAVAQKRLRHVPPPPRDSNDPAAALLSTGHSAMKHIDLSHPFHSGMPTFAVPWHPYVEITQLGRFGIEGRQTHRIGLGTHTGTHMDAPSHFIPGGGDIASIPLTYLHGAARLLDMGSYAEKQAFDVDYFAHHLGEEHPQRLVLRFRWSQYWGTLHYYTKNPFITEAAAQWLIDRGVRVLGMDVPQVDSPDHGRGCGKDSPIHQIMLGQGCFFVENLVNLDLITGTQFNWIVAPLLLPGCDGAPCRSFAIETDQ